MLPLYVCFKSSRVPGSDLYHCPVSYIYSIVVDPSQRALILPQGGPQSVNAYQGLWSKLTKEFPNAEIVASTFDNFTDILQSKRATLPRLSKEIGDTWVRPPRAPDQQLAFAISSHCSQLYWISAYDSIVRARVLRAHH